MILLTKDFIKTAPMIFVTGLLVLTGCGKEQKGLLPNGIKVKVQTSATKGAETTTSSLTSFQIDAFLDHEEYINPDDGSTVPVSGGHYISGQTVSYASGEWTISGNPEWVAGDTTHFWGVSPVSRNGSLYYYDSSWSTGTTTLSEGLAAETLYCSYIVPTSTSGTADATSQEDLIMAYASKKYLIDTPATVDDDEITLTFHHALSKIIFCVSPDDGTFDETVKIKDISINGVYKGGYFTFNGANAAGLSTTDRDSENSPAFTWSALSGVDVTKDYTQTVNAAFIDSDYNYVCPSGWTDGSYTQSSITYKLYTYDNSFFLAPQILPDDASITVTFVVDGEDKPVTVELTGEDVTTSQPNGVWKPDRYYKYKINVSQLREISLGISLVNWEEYDDKLFIK